MEAAHGPGQARTSWDPEGWSCPGLGTKPSLGETPCPARPLRKGQQARSKSSLNWQGGCQHGKPLKKELSSSWWPLGLGTCQPVRVGLPESRSQQPQAPDSSLGTHPEPPWPQKRVELWPRGCCSPECPGVKGCSLGVSGFFFLIRRGYCPSWDPGLLRVGGNAGQSPSCKRTLHPKKAAGQSSSRTVRSPLRPQAWLQASQTRKVFKY